VLSLVYARSTSFPEKNLIDYFLPGNIARISAGMSSLPLVLFYFLDRRTNGSIRMQP